MDKDIKALEDIVLGPTEPYVQTITTTGRNVDIINQMKNDQKRRFENAKSFIE